MSKVFFFLMLSLSLISCKDNEMPTPEPPIVNPIDTSCVECKNCKEGDGINGPLCVWKSPIINKGEGLSGNFKPLIHNDLVIINSSQDGDDTDNVVFYNKHSGKKIAVWDDYAMGDPSGLTDQSFYAYGNTLMIGTGTRVYAVDLTTFKTKFMTQSHNWGDLEMGGIGTTTFHHTFSEDQKTIYLEKGSTENKNIEIIYQETVPVNIKVVIEAYNTYVDGKDTILLFWLGKYNLDTYVLDWYLTAYNITQKKLLYQEKLNEFDGDTGLAEKPMVKDGRIYISVGHGVYCLDIKTGAHIWRFKLPNHHTAEAIIGDDDKVYATSQGVPEATLHCLDKNTGQELWNIKTDNSLQNLVFHKDIIYSVPSGAVRINAIDTKQQKILWKYKCSETKPGVSIYYLPYINIDKSTGNLFIGSNTTLYCLKAI